MTVKLFYPHSMRRSRFHRERLASTGNASLPQGTPRFHRERLASTGDASLPQGTPRFHRERLASTGDAWYHRWHSVVGIVGLPRGSIYMYMCIIINVCYFNFLRSYALNAVKSSVVFWLKINSIGSLVFLMTSLSSFIKLIWIVETVSCNR